MKLNITVNDDPKSKITPVNELETGTVYKIAQGVTMLKIEGACPMILTFSSGTPWFELSHKGWGNFADEPAVEVLGQLTGIEVTK